MVQRRHNKRKVLENIFTKKLLLERKLWDKIILENALRVTVSVKYFDVSLTEEGTQALVFFVLSHIQNHFKNGKYRKKTRFFYKKMRLKNPKALREC